MTFKIIPRSYSPYKLLSIYAIKEANNSIGIGAFICLKYKDSESYNFIPNTCTTYFDKAQIKALKTCESFIKKPYIVPCLFHYSQAILKKFKKLNIIKKKLDKHSYELLRNLEILCFIIPKNLKKYYQFLKYNLFLSEKEKEFMDYYKKEWINKYKEAFNYYDLIHE